MARISLSPPRTRLFRGVEWYSRRVYGKVLDPLRALAHNSRVLWSYVRLEQSVAKWNRLDPDLKALAEMTSASRRSRPTTTVRSPLCRVAWM